jgi:hypothetical protein
MKIHIYNPINLSTILESTISEIDLAILQDSQRELFNQLTNSDYGNLRKSIIQNYLFKTLIEFKMNSYNFSDTQTEIVLRDLSISRQKFVYQKIFQKGDPYEKLLKHYF